MALGTVILPFDIASYGQPSKCILNGITDGNLASSFGLVAGDQFNLALYPRNQSATVGNPTTTAALPAGCSIVVSGKPATAPNSSSVLFLANAFTPSVDGSGNNLYTGYLDLDTTELAAAIGSQVSIPVLLVIDVISSSGKPQRFLAFITIYNETYSGSEGAPTPATPAYLTAVQTEQAFLANWNFITALSGGGGTHLDAQPTFAEIVYGQMFALVNVTDPVAGGLVNGGGLTIWQFQNRTDATGPGLQRPLDFDATTNPGVFVKIL